jgi:NAD(P)-dependent dehydrogenase (short-subunit alcohol dehydrogenase family)
MRVVLTARDAERAEKAAAELASEGLDVVGRPLDVANAGSIDRFAAALADEVDAVDVLVSNAAAPVAWDERASVADLDGVRATLEVNLLGPWRLVQALLPLVRRSAAGRIVVVSSGAGSHADAAFGLTVRGGNAAAYGVSKAALNALVSTFAAELDGDVLVNAVCPGLTATFDGAEQMGARPVEAGARSVTWAALRAETTGGYFRDGRRMGW